jgi:DNA mismatch repair protein MutS
VQHPGAIPLEGTAPVAACTLARLAGLPLSVIDRAKLILCKLESDDTEVELPSPEVRVKKKLTVKPGDAGQLDLL